MDQPGLPVRRATPAALESTGPMAKLDRLDPRVVRAVQLAQQGQQDRMVRLVLKVLPASMDRQAQLASGPQAQLDRRVPQGPPEHPEAQPAQPAPRVPQGLQDQPARLALVRLVRPGPRVLLASRARLDQPAPRARLALEPPAQPALAEHRVRPVPPVHRGEPLAQLVSPEQPVLVARPVLRDRLAVLVRPERRGPLAQREASVARAQRDQPVLLAPPEQEERFSMSWSRRGLPVVVAPRVYRLAHSKTISTRIRLTSKILARPETERPMTPRHS